MRKAYHDATTTAWAAVIQNPRTRWVAADTIAYTRREAKQKYLDGVSPEFHKRVLEGVSFVRVTITEDTTSG